MNKRAIAGWVLSVLITAFLIFSASGKFLDWEGKEEMLAKMGWTVDTVKAIGVVEVVIALLLLVPRAAFLAAVLLSAYYGGAVATHVRMNDAFWFPIALGVLTWIAVGLRDGRVFDAAFGAPRKVDSAS